MPIPVAVKYTLGIVRDSVKTGSVLGGRVPVTCMVQIVNGIQGF